MQGIPDPQKEAVACNEIYTEDLLFGLKMVHEGISVDQAADLSGLERATVERVLQAAVDVGLVIAPTR